MVSSWRGEVILRRLPGEAVTQQTSGMSKEEWWEFVEVFEVQEDS